MPKIMRDWLHMMLISLVLFILGILLCLLCAGDQGLTNFLKTIPLPISVLGGIGAITLVLCITILKTYSVIRQSSFTTLRFPSLFGKAIFFFLIPFTLVGDLIVYGNFQETAKFCVMAGIICLIFTGAAFFSTLLGEIFIGEA